MSEDDLVKGMEQARRQAEKTAAAKGKKPISTAAAKDLAVAANRGKTALKKARGRTSLQALSKLTEVVDGRPRIVSQPPLLVPLRELGDYYGLDATQLDTVVKTQFDRYRATLGVPRKGGAAANSHIRSIPSEPRELGLSIGTRSSARKHRPSTRSRARAERTALLSAYSTTWSA